MDDRPLPERWPPGTRVYVLLVEDNTHHEGTVLRYEPLIVSDGPREELFSENYPILALDDGREVGGLECWWTAIPDEDGLCGTSTSERT